jgi:hypothetical protein
MPTIREMISLALRSLIYLPSTKAAGAKPTPNLIRWYEIRIRSDSVSRHSPARFPGPRQDEDEAHRRVASVSGSANSKGCKPPPYAVTNRHQCEDENVEKVAKSVPNPKTLAFQQIDEDGRSAVM